MRMSIYLDETKTITQNSQYMLETTHASQSISFRAGGSRETLGDRRNKGFTMAEIMVVIVVMGILALIAVPIYNNVRGAGLDTVKAKNAATLNQLMTTIHNAGVDTTGWTTSALAITALSNGVALPTVTPSAQAQQIILRDSLNPNAYTFTPGTATTAPFFVPILNQPTIPP